MSRRVYLYFALIFLLGAVAGAAGMFYYGWYAGRWHPHFDKQRILRDLRRKLDLSDAQTQQVKQVLDETETKFKALRSQAAPQFEAIRKESQDRIRRILTPEQAVKFDEHMRRVKERMERMERHGGP